MARVLRGVLFALHPVQVEPVAWVSGMNNLICAAFSLSAIWLYVRHAQTRKWIYVICATIAFVLALFSKPMARSSSQSSPL